MSLKLGKTFNRSYTLRLPFLDGFYNIGIFFDKRSSFLLFRVDPDFSSGSFKHNVQLNMFKNLESSVFCETFIKLHNYRKNTLDISNQFDRIKDDYVNDISFLLNESIVLSKVDLFDREVYDTLNIYGFVLNSFLDEFIFLITERQNIIKRLGKKIVRTSGIQIATKPAISLIEEFHKESKIAGKAGREQRIPTDKIIKFSEAEQEAINDGRTD